MRYASCLIALTIGLGGAAQASLSGEKDINARLAVVATADMIRKGCGSIDARMVRAYAFLRETASQAQARGYTRDQIEAYVDDDAAKEVVESGARAYLEEKGGMDEAALCATGQAEIAAGTAIGRLLK